MKTITKAVIPIGGFGTRLLPITKAIPKEMLPIIDKPVIQYIIEELANSGIKEVYMIISREKEAIVNYFSRNEKLEKRLIMNNKKVECQEIIDISSIMKVHFILEEEQQGSASAIYLAKQYIKKDEPFVIVLGDDLIKNDEPAINQLINVYNKTGNNVIGVHEVEDNELNRYGIIKVKDKNQNTIDSIIEKPKIKDAPSNLAVLGRYLVTGDIFDYIKKTKKGIGNEYQLTDALKLMMENKEFNYKVINGNYYDIGSREGYINAMVDYAKESTKIDKNKLTSI